MRITVLGTGVVGRTLAAGFERNGHLVTLGTRDPAGTSHRDDFSEWAGQHGAIPLATYADAAADAEVVVNATNGAASVSTIEGVGAEKLAGKVLVDVSNPLDFSQGFPPTLSVKDTDSLGEQIQRAVPTARVVKAFNTVNAAVMVDPRLVGDGDTTVFVAGDDEAAKETVRGLMTEFGWSDIVDMGGIGAARGLEMWIALWVRLMGTFGTPMFNLKLVR
jgi:8-hydroxy-5-deazaflavin:NADPH oxidoreductase